LFYRKGFAKDRKDEVPTMKLQPIAKKGGPEKAALDDVVQKDESVTIRHFDCDRPFAKTGSGSLPVWILSQVEFFRS